MPLSKHWTLTRFLIEERRRFPQASGDLNALILDIALACKAIARIVAFGELQDAFGPLPLVQGAQTDAGGGTRKPLGALAGEVFVRMNEWNGHLGAMASAGAAAPLQIPAQYPRGKYLLVFDPLDGAADIDVNLPVGSIFSIHRAQAEMVQAGRDAAEADFLPPGAQQVAAGYALYGPTTMLVLSVGSGVSGFTLNPNLGEFVLTHAQIRLPEETQEFAIDSANSRFWEPPVKRYVDECLAGRSGARGKDFNMRWIASLVAEAHRILLRGGVFLYPRDMRDAAQPGRLRLVHECNPLGFIIEQAGGRASTGRQPLLGLKPTGLQQRVPLVFGSRHEVERIERYHREPARDTGNPLFAERGLFRD